MTPQHTTYGNHPRAYSYCATSTQAAYSVPLMPNRERVFFPDDSDPLLLAYEDPDPISRLLPPPPHQQQQQQTQSQSMSTNQISQQMQQQQQQQPSQCFELSCVPTHKYAHHGGSGCKKEDDGGNGMSTEGLFRNPPSLSQQQQSTGLTNQPSSSASTLTQMHLPPVTSMTGNQSSNSPSAITGSTFKKVKKKPEPIVIPSVS